MLGHSHWDRQVSLESLIISDRNSDRIIIYRVLWQHTCLMVMAGFHDFSSSRIERQTVPEGNTFGWNKGGANLPVIKYSLQPQFISKLHKHFGGLDG